MRRAFFPHRIRPDGSLHFTDVDASEKKHAQPGLTDAASDRQGEPVLKDGPVVGEGGAVCAVGCDQLFHHGIGVHADTHAGYFERTAERLEPEQDIAVQAPVVVVRRASVMRLAVRQGAADFADEDGSVLFGDEILSFLSRPVIKKISSGRRYTASG